jgi:methyl-accepting chemotaxis protein
MSFTRLSIGKKLGLGFLILVLVVIFTNLVSTFGLLTIREKWELTEDSEDLHTSLMQREIEHLQWVMVLQEHLISESAEGFSLQLDPTKCNLGQWLGSEDFQHLLERYPSFAATFEQLYGPHVQLHTSAQTIKSLLEAGDTAGAQEIYHSVTIPSLTQTRGILGEVRSELDQDVHDLSVQMRGLMSSIVQQILIIATVGIVLSVVSAVIVTRRITKPLKVLREAAHRVGDGDLAASWTIKSGDEIGDLSQSLRDMVVSLRQLVKGIQENSEMVNSLSQSLSSMAVQTGAAITEVASTSNEFSSTSVAMAENADAMRGNTEHAMGELERGLEMLRTAVGDVASARQDVQDLTEAVDSLAERSRQIDDIVELISEISEQTNLLALNAAIEAARAGENGRGFAVVAEEVRRLAEQSKSATGEIAELIQEILRGTAETIQRMNKADSSVEKVDEQIDLTGNTFAAISRVFQEVAQQVAEIAKAAEDVGAGSEEIAASTEEQSAVANSIAEESEKLAHMAGELQRQISRFRGF